MKKYKRKSIWKHVIYYRYIYLLLIPVFLYYAVFKYAPMYGIQLAFKKYNLQGGITGSPWIGFENFEYLFKRREFWQALKNTTVISFMKLILGFPISVILAILLNEIIFVKLKKIFQVIFTFPHFLSWVILSSIMFNLLANSGAVNNLLELSGFQRINFLTNKESFRFLLVYSEVWKEAGWGTIIYIATIANIDPSLYEAAIIDGANRWNKIRYITWPGIKSVVITMLILQVGHMMSAGFMQIFNLYNPSVYSVADILDTYIYRETFNVIPNFGLTTAMGLFTGLTNCILLLTANFISKKFGEKGIV